MQFSEFVGRMVEHERLPAAIDPRLRRAAWVAVGVLGAAWALALFGSWLAEQGSVSALYVGEQFLRRVSGATGWAAVLLKASTVALLVALALAAWTRGFNEAGPAAQWGVAGLVGTGGVAAMPVAATLLVVLVNLAILLLIIAVGIAVGVFLIAMLLDS